MKNELKEIGIKNCACYYFENIINGTFINLSDILLEEKLYEKISIYDILYKTSKVQKPLHIRLDKLDGFITVLNGKMKHLLLFDHGLFNKICDKIKYLIRKKVVLKIVLMIICKDHK